MPRNDLKAYTSLIARIPQELADQVKRYASEHRSTVSELIRDGLEMRLDTDLSWHAPGARPDAESEVLPEVLHTLEAMAPMLRALVQDTVRETMAEVIQEVLHLKNSLHTTIRGVIQEVLPPGVEVLHGHTSTLQAPSAAMNGGMTKVIPEPAPPAQPSPQGMTEVFPFDTAKYVLGKLCPRGHAWGNTGQSLLRRTNRHCCACDREKFQERGKGQRQARKQQQRQQEGQG